MSVSRSTVRGADALVVHPQQEGENPCELPAVGLTYCFTNKNNTLWQCNWLIVCAVVYASLLGLIFAFFTKCQLKFNEEKHNLTCMQRLYLINTLVLTLSIRYIYRDRALHQAANRRSPQGAIDRPFTLVVLWGWSCVDGNDSRERQTFVRWFKYCTAKIINGWQESLRTDPSEILGQ